MSSATPPRTRSQRVASVELPPGLWKKFTRSLAKGNVLVRVAMCLAAGMVLWLVTRGWSPPFEYYRGQIIDRDILPRVEFSQADEEKTLEARRQARSLAKAVYRNDPKPLEQILAKLENAVGGIVASEDFQQLEPDIQQAFLQGTADEEDAATRFTTFKEAFAGENALETFRDAIANSFEPFKRNGMINALPEEHTANFETISVVRGDANQEANDVSVSQVLLENAGRTLQQRLKDRIAMPVVADWVVAWIKPQLPETLTLDQEATTAVQDAAARNTAIVYRKLLPEAAPTNILAHAGQELDEAAIALLRLEHAAVLANQSFTDKLRRSFATLGMYFALCCLCGFYIFAREPETILHYSRLARLLGLVVVTVTLAMVASGEMIGDKWWQAHLIPLLLFGMIAAIAYRQELALLLSAGVMLIVVTALGDGLIEALILLATVAGAILVLGRIRSRSKLLTVGLVAAIVAFLTTLGVGSLHGMPLALLLAKGAKFALWSIIAGSLMTCILPLIEKAFSVQTDLSLIELGDPAHPLLQELVRRAPGTYNHSITVASLAEAATEAIGGRGLLVRVGAYFHDIGKMLKPGYFVENQSRGDNRHESLVPAMSTLVIIAHVKDGADLARQHGLPQQIIDFIQQHHGTTLVEYFYRRASEQSGANPDGGEVDESSFRYPGPKPQSKEAAVLMISDAVESASRVLVDPTPARIESLVEEISMKRLLDGQFDECGLTLEELHRIEGSLAKSLTAVYHGRVKYPEQETA